MMTSSLVVSLNRPQMAYTSFNYFYPMVKDSTFKYIQTLSEMDSLNNYRIIKLEGGSRENLKKKGKTEEHPRSPSSGPYALV